MLRPLNEAFAPDNGPPAAGCGQPRMPDAT